MNELDTNAETTTGYISEPVHTSPAKLSWEEVCIRYRKCCNQDTFILRCNQLRKSRGEEKVSYDTFKGWESKGYVAPVMLEVLEASERGGYGPFIPCQYRPGSLGKVDKKTKKIVPIRAAPIEKQQTFDMLPAAVKDVANQSLKLRTRPSQLFERLAVVEYALRNQFNSPALANDVAEFVAFVKTLT